MEITQNKERKKKKERKEIEDSFGDLWDSFKHIDA